MFGDHQGLVPRPSLLGAIVGKSVAVDVDDVPDAQRLDLALLLSLVGDPIELAEQLTKKDRQRLRARTEMAVLAVGHRSAPPSRRAVEHVVR